jgi:hypothetical protein
LLVAFASTFKPLPVKIIGGSANERIASFPASLYLWLPARALDLVAQN